MFTQTSSEVTTQGAIAWSNDDPYVQAMGRPEYPGCVRRVGFGVLPARSRPRSLTPATQDPTLLQQVSVLTTRLAVQEATHQTQLAAQNDPMVAQETRLAQMQTLLESFMSNPELETHFHSMAPKGYTS
ncbi:hypothetical protein SLA2020_280880 [Shorea laevis]